MTESQPMASLRRRPMPGMASSATSHSEPEHPELPGPGIEVSGSGSPAQQDSPAHVQTRPAGGSAHEEHGSIDRADHDSDVAVTAGRRVRRRPAVDYSTTRLVNFRIPVDLHDRYRQLVRDAEREYPRLRHPSLTELIIALLEEGPSTAEEVAELIRRKRVAEHNPGASS
jgi:hypothetical protein